MKTRTLVTTAALSTLLTLSSAQAFTKTLTTDPNVLTAVRSRSTVDHPTSAGIEQACNLSLINGKALLKRTDGCLVSQVEILRDANTDVAQACASMIIVYKAPEDRHAGETGPCATDVPLYRAPGGEVLAQERIK